MTEAHHLLAFQTYQQAFTAHIRNPTQAMNALLQDIPIERLAVYEEIVFTNIFEAVSACFPVAKAVLGKSVWHDLVRGFLSEHSATSPIFRQIPAEFLSYLAQITKRPESSLPAFILSLCHYEWVELAVSTYNNPPYLGNNFIEDVDFKAPATLAAYVVFSSSLFLCHYDYAVQTISPNNVPNTKTPTQLLVYCDSAFKVQFLILNPATLLLLQLLQGKPQDLQHRYTAQVITADMMTSPFTVGDALLRIASVLPNSAPDMIRAFGLDFLTQLYAQGIILGIRTPDIDIND